MNALLMLVAVVFAVLVALSSAVPTGPLDYSSYADDLQRIASEEQPMMDKRAQTFVRFGKRAQTFVRFGKRAQTFVRFGRSAPVAVDVDAEQQPI